MLKPSQVELIYVKSKTNLSAQEPYITPQILPVQLHVCFRKHSCVLSSTKKNILRNCMYRKEAQVTNLSFNKCTFYFHLRVSKLSESRSSAGLDNRFYLDRQQSISTDKDLDSWEVRRKETFRKDVSRA